MSLRNRLKLIKKKELFHFQRKTPQNESKQFSYKNFFRELTRMIVIIVLTFIGFNLAMESESEKTPHSFIIFQCNCVFAECREVWTII